MQRLHGPDLERTLDECGLKKPGSGIRRPATAEQHAPASSARTPALSAVVAAPAPQEETLP